MSTILVAYDTNGLIGHGDRLPWRIPRDLQLFKKRTVGEAVIMGRKTYESLPDKNRPLSNRKNIVLTKGTSDIHRDDEVDYVHTPYEALEVAAFLGLHPYIIGGAQVYKTFLDLDLVDKIIVSEVKGEYEGDVYFPYFDFDAWDRKIIDSYKEFDVVEYQKKGK